MPEKPDYDLTSIFIDPPNLGPNADDLVSEATAIVQSLQRIMRALQEVWAAWEAESAQRAEEINARWARTMRQMFGEEGGADGVLGVMATGIKGTAVSFSQTEVSLETMWNNFISELGKPGTGDLPTTSPADDNEGSVHRGYRR